MRHRTESRLQKMRGVMIPQVNSMLPRHTPVTHVQKPMGMMKNVLPKWRVVRVMLLEKVRDLVLTLSVLGSYQKV